MLTRSRRALCGCRQGHGRSAGCRYSPCRRRTGGRAACNSRTGVSVASETARQWGSQNGKWNSRTGVSAVSGTARRGLTWRIERPDGAASMVNISQTEGSIRTTKQPAGGDMAN